MSVILLQIKSLLMHGIVGYLNYHTFIVFMVVFTIVDGLRPGRNLLVLFIICDWLSLAITIITTSQITNNNCASR